MDAAQRHLAEDRGARVARTVLLDEEAPDGAVLGSIRIVHPRPDERDAARCAVADPLLRAAEHPFVGAVRGGLARSEEHTSELQSLMRTSYAVFCLKKKK